jgi:hypothetical protein
VQEQIAEQLRTSRQIVAGVLNNPGIDRRELAVLIQKDIERCESAGPDSPWYPVANEFRALLQQLDLANYTPPTEEQQVAIQIGQAEDLVQRTLSNPSMNRNGVAKRIAEFIEDWEAKGVDSPWYPGAQKLRELHKQLQTDGKMNVMEQLQLVMAESKVIRALEDPNSDRQALLLELEADAHKIEQQDPNSEYFASIAHSLRKLAQLVRDESKIQP